MIRSLLNVDLGEVTAAEMIEACNEVSARSEGSLRESRREDILLALVDRVNEIRRRRRS